MSVTKRIKVALITNIPAYYRVDLFRFLARHDLIDFRVFFYALRTKEAIHARTRSLPQEISWVDTSSWCWPLGKGYIHVFSASLFQALCSFRPDVLISINASLVTLGAALWAKWYCRPLIVWWAGTPLSERKVSIWRKALRRWIFRQASLLFAYGHQAKHYLLNVGCPEEKIVVLGNVTIDVQRYRSRVDEYLQRACQKECVNILAVGQFIARKNFCTVLRAFRKLYTAIPSVHLTLVGDGPLRSKLQRYVERHSLPVTFTGLRPPEEMPRYYAEADIFIHIPYLDTWPQVINEAMASGLPVIVSDQSGIDDDLIISGQEGIVVSPWDEDTIVHALIDLARNPDLRLRMGQRAFQRIATRDVKKTAQLIIQAIESVVH